MLTHLIPSGTLRDRDDSFPHSRGEETKAQRGSICASSNYPWSSASVPACGVDRGYRRDPEGTLESGCPLATLLPSPSTSSLALDMGAMDPPPATPGQVLCEGAPSSLHPARGREKGH